MRLIDETDETLIPYENNGWIYRFFWGYNAEIYNTLNEPIFDLKITQLIIRFWFLWICGFLSLIGPYTNGAKEYLTFSCWGCYMTTIAYALLTLQINPPDYLK
jgi:hypothetical protein